MANGSTPYLHTSDGDVLDFSTLSKKVDRIVKTFDDYAQFCDEGGKVPLSLTSLAHTDTALRGHPVASAALAKLEEKARTRNLQVDYHYDNGELVGDLVARH